MDKSIRKLDNLVKCFNILTLIGISLSDYFFIQILKNTFTATKKHISKNYN
jgi:hypothetical protein